MANPPPKLFYRVASTMPARKPSMGIGFGPVGTELPSTLNAGGRPGSLSADGVTIDLPAGAHTEYSPWVTYLQLAVDLKGVLQRLRGFGEHVIETTPAESWIITEDRFVEVFCCTVYETQMPIRLDNPYRRDGT